MQDTTHAPGSAPAAKPKKQATRQRLLDAAVSSLIELGVARTTTLEVQRRSGTSRGALLHHFPTHAALLSATIAELVQRNDEAVRRAEAEMAAVPNPIERAIRTLAAMSRQPAYLAELELWAASRTDPDLQKAIRNAERAARGERERVISNLFSSIRDNPNFDAITSLSVEFLRGMALSSVLAESPDRYERLITQWIGAVETLLRAS